MTQREREIDRDRDREIERDIERLEETDSQQAGDGRRKERGRGKEGDPGGRSPETLTIRTITEIMGHLSHKRSGKQKLPVGTFQALTRAQMMAVSLLEKKRGPVISGRWHWCSGAADVGTRYTSPHVAPASERVAVMGVGRGNQTVNTLKSSEA